MSENPPVKKVPIVEKSDSAKLIESAWKLTRESDPRKNKELWKEVLCRAYPDLLTADDKKKNELIEHHLRHLYLLYLINKNRMESLFKDGSVLLAGDPRLHKLAWMGIFLERYGAYTPFDDCFDAIKLLYDGKEKFRKRVTNAHPREAEERRARATQERAQARSKGFFALVFGTAPAKPLENNKETQLQPISKIKGAIWQILRAWGLW
ncbi:hypothetical protein BDK51DRAFT_30600 [Blyttiomyces helicus]|uniref:Uncharacterized protein n=1 Tax=Blyttiomyces helicus TaxID=388810 RepID=A0A4P9WIW9_9FUNG|nr:hypothetical protein BDK51DRAFT_30600 [Blyttiomyces helicus]|eukprot:RKO91985.1 hypothetical protein BDK51DRAFT_30600 [Blyttiomyces helicus]